MGRLRTTYCRQGSKRVANRLWPVSIPKDSIRTCVLTFDTAKYGCAENRTVKKFDIRSDGLPIETAFNQPFK